MPDEYRFLALDFETANESRDSACSVALVGFWGGRRVFSRYYLIRPPTNWMRHQGIHGITWRMVADAPTFAELWPSLEPMFDGAHFVAAHNASFDRGVLEACCRAAGLPAPALPFLCTVRLARDAWNVRPTRLPDVCSHLGLELTHHHALSDAEACAQIVVRAGPDHVRAALARTAAGRRR
jgi:DNA polymerase-3 subunit epsilon